MKKIVNRRWTWLAACAALAFGLAFIATNMSGSQSKAEALPGLVLQTSEASSGGVVVRLERALFTGKTVDVSMRVDGVADGSLATVLGSDVEMNSSQGLLTKVHRDGMSTVRFAGDAWPEQGAETTLRVTALNVRDINGKTSRVDGDWRLTVQLPTGEDASAARMVQDLQPTTLQVDGASLYVEAYRMPAATVVRYELPEGVYSLAAPVILDGNRKLEARQSQQADTFVEAWYEPTDTNNDLILEFGDLRIHTQSGGWSVGFTVDPDSSDSDLRWTQLPSSTEPTVTALTWSKRGRSDFDYLDVVVQGYWDSGRDGAAPTAYLDGSETKVRSYGGSQDNGGETRITIEVVSGHRPIDVVISANGGTEALDAVVARLTP